MKGGGERKAQIQHRVKHLPWRGEYEDEGE